MLFLVSKESKNKHLERRVNKVAEMVTLFAFYSLSPPTLISPLGWEVSGCPNTAKNSASQNFIMFYYCGLLTFKKLKFSWHTILY